MKTNSLTKKVLGSVFGLSLLLGIGLGSSSVAQAQYQDPYWRQEQIRRQREWEREQRRRERQARGRYDNGRYDNRGYDRGVYDNLPDYGGSSQLRQTALNAGYNQGIKAGRKDRSRGERYEYRDEGAFQSASADYNSRFGNRALYQQYFREGFINGYTDGYRGY